MINRIKPILLVEDDQVDVMTVKRSLKQLHVINPLFVTHNGEEALEYLNAENSELPCFILLDINMPKMSGLEFLKKIKKQIGFHDIPVIMLTSSMEQQDIDRSFELEISGYILKPVEYEQFVDSISILNAYWTVSHPD